MRIIDLPACASDRASALVILLPAALQQPEALIAAGFGEAIRLRKLALDLMLVDAGLQYVGDADDGAFLAQFDSLLAAAIQHGYRHIWLGGISLGAYMVLAYEARQSGLTRAPARAGTDTDQDRLRGLCLLAPYPGSRLLASEIDAAGGLANWARQAATPLDGEGQIWHWLNARRGQNEGAPATSVSTRIGMALPIHLGYGQQDRFADGQQRMAQALAFDQGDCVDVVEGGHDEAVWLRLWEHFLDAMAGKLDKADASGAQR